MAEAEGVDLVEVGLSFSDPLADGPIIQRSIHQVLSAGFSVDDSLRLIEQAQLKIPVVLFSYLNPILAYGIERFSERAAEAGAAGILLTDLPAGTDPDRGEKFLAGPLDLIRLVAPTTPDERLQRIGETAQGFVYLIARLGVTGARTDITGDLDGLVQRVRRVTDLPVAVGFGIQSADQVRQVGRVADGIVVGSALVDRLGRGIDQARELIRELSSAVRSPAL